MWPSKNQRELFFKTENDFKPNEIMTRLPLTINIRFRSTLARTRRNYQVYGEEYWERIGLLEPGTGLLGVTWRKGEIISINNS